MLKSIGAMLLGVVLVCSTAAAPTDAAAAGDADAGDERYHESVSYTHLTLPTIYSV